MPTKQPVAVDLFCGAGGLSFGLQRAGIRIAAGIDIDESCRYAFEENVNAPFHALDVGTVSADFVKSLFPEDCVTVLAGCAPCQPFSSYTNGRAGPEEQWQLLRKFGELIESIKPDVVTMENVARLQRHRVFQEFMDVLDDNNYIYERSKTVVRCADYGVPQTRRRLVILASRFGKLELLPPTHLPTDHVSVEEAIRDLEPISAGGYSRRDRLHRSSRLNEKNLARIRHSRPGGTWQDWRDDLVAACHTTSRGRSYKSVYGRMRWDRPAPTITTQFNGFGNGRFGHPEQDRAISLREGALLQTFPESYRFIPDSEPVQFSPIARMIGNAVPPKLAEAIGKSILAHVKDIHGSIR
ncbi:MAG: DNA cytosine methyltransferase [Chloroflexi bacterium]|nr:DNA cytosine methyltransferase [Chloroflexota bacterium]